MSQVFTLKSTNYILSIDFINPLFLDETSDYGLALIGFYSYNSIPNIESDKNKFTYTDVKTKETKTVAIPTGSYEISDIETYIRQKIIPKEVKQEHYDRYISIKPNNNTLKCEIQSEYFHVDFRAVDSIGKVLGFSPRVLKRGQLYESDLPVNIVNVRTLHIDCNITTGAFYNHKPSHTIYEFAIDVDPGYAINEIPRNLTYLPLVNKREISNITLSILDQDFNPVNFRNEDIIVRLELKKWA